jgi:hypothetical protein
LIALLNLLVCLGIALAGGVGSALYMISTGSPLTTRHIGPWEVWKDAGRVEADPYTRAHFATSGRLPTGSRNALYFLASRDSTGRALSANCDYAISGRGPNAQWWSVSAYNQAGQLFPNAAERFAYGSATVMRTADGIFTITVSRDARAGNWLPVAGGGPFKLMLSVYGLETEDRRGTQPQDQAGLPVIRKEACR